MSLRLSTRSHLAALIIGCAVLLQGCAVLDSGTAPAASGDAVDARAPLWQIIDGGLTSAGNTVIGPDHIRFLQPVAVAARGHLVYILDVGHRQLFRYDSRLDRLSLAMDLHGVVTGDEADLYLARDLSLYIADTDGARVLHYDRDGRLIKIIEDRVSTGRPVAVAVNDMTGYIFIADGFNDVVLVYNPAGLFEGLFGGRGRGPGQFTNITALSQGPNGYYVGSRLGDHRIQVMALTGDYRDSFESETVRFPTAIAVSRTGLVFVSDYLTDDIKVFDKGVLVDVIGGHGSAPGRFKRITSLWLDDRFLYVADSLNGRIQMLSLTSWELSPPKEP